MEMRGAAREFAFSNANFQAIVERIRDSSGIVLAETKRDLVYGRLVPRLRTLGCRNFNEYLQVLRGPDGKSEQTVLVNAITTNLTGFFREKHHFDTLARDALPELMRGPPPQPLRIWSAGCSSGQEPYSIAMVLNKALPDPQGRDALILATDIDSDMIAHGRAGLYDADAASTIPAPYRGFVHDAGNGEVAMSDKLKAMIRFKRLNLIGDWPMRGMFDIIFCRNVVIYFDKDTQRALFDRYADILRPGGWLFIGHSESLYRVSDRFTHLGHTMYRKIK